MAVGFNEDTTPEILRKKTKKDIDSVICCVTQTGVASGLVGKYRPPCPILVVSTNDQTLRQSGVYFGQIPLKVDTYEGMDIHKLTELAAVEITNITKQGHMGTKIIVACGPNRGPADEQACVATEITNIMKQGHVGTKIIVACGPNRGPADEQAVVTVSRMGGGISKHKSSNALLTQSGMPVSRPGTLSLRSTLTSLPLIVKPVMGSRATKIICTMGPKCWGEESISELLDAGMDIIRLNFSHGDHDAHYKVLERFRKICAVKSEAHKIKLTRGDHEAHYKVLERFHKICAIKSEARMTKAHYKVLDRFRKISAIKSEAHKTKGNLVAAPQWAALLDTKGPEIRTAMLRDHVSIDLEAGQTIIVEGVGARYTEFEGYKDAKETRIGLSYDKLCQSVTVGNKILLADGSLTIRVEEVLSNKILLADGSLSIRVEEVLSATELRGTVLNSKTLGERKNCNLPGVKVDIPVLTEKDIHDLQEFAAKYELDYVAASFVQSKEDVRFIRRILNEAGGFRVKIISKIENAEGMLNYDEILKESDGIMVARGDLGMEIPAEKVPLAQKLMITKANIAGKFTITATQMLESMCTNPRPTRAEMTDVANAVLDGTDCVMLSGETANGDFPTEAVSTMAAICKNAEEMVEVTRRYDFIRNQTPKPMMGAEAMCSGAVQSSIDADAKAIIVITNSGRAPGMVSKFRPSAPVFVVTPDAQLVRHCRSVYGQIGILRETVDDDPTTIMNEVMNYGRELCSVHLKDGDHVVLLMRRQMPRGSRIPFDDQRLTMKVVVLGEANAISAAAHTAYTGKSIVFHRSTKMSINTILDDTKYKHMSIVFHRSTKMSFNSILDDTKYKHMDCKMKIVCTMGPASSGSQTPRCSDRKTKIICTMGPACWSEEMLAKLLDAGMDVARFNFSHGDHDGQYAGPEIRTAMLRDHKPIDLEAGQSIIVESVGDRYTDFEGYKDEKETRIGLSYDKVEEVLSATELRGTVLNSKTLGERKNCNLPGVKVDIPVLTVKDIGDLQNFAAKHEMDFVAASFSKADVEHIRRVLDAAGGQGVKIISKIENAEGLQNFDEILEVTDGIMVARGDLGMEIPVEKKMMITKANIAGKFIITATQMMESMISNPIPTRAEMTDVANAVFDGTDCVMLSGESANGSYPSQTVTCMANICRSSEIGTNICQVFDYIRSFTPKPVSGIESIACAVAKNAVDMQPGMIVVFSEHGKTPRLIAKYRPPAPVLVVTSCPKLARSCASQYGMHPMLLDKPVEKKEDLEKHIEKALAYGVEIGICMAGKEVIVLTSTSVACNQKKGDLEKHIKKALAYGVEIGICMAGKKVIVLTSTSVACNQLDLTALGTLAPTFTSTADPKIVTKIISMRSTNIDLDMLMEDTTPSRKTKIAATIGPSSASPEILENMVDAGMDVARFKFSHGSPSSHQTIEVVKTLRKICAAKNRPVAVLMDLQGPELRTSYLVDGPNSQTRVDSIDLESGDTVRFYGTEELDEESFVGYKTSEGVVLGVDLSDFPEVVPVGTILSLYDGAISIRVESVSPRSVHGVVLNPGTLGERKVLYVAGIKLLASFARSMQDMQSTLGERKVLYVAGIKLHASFARSMQDMQSVQDMQSTLGERKVLYVAGIKLLASFARSMQDMQSTLGERHVLYVAGIKLHASFARSMQDMQSTLGERKVLYVAGVKLHASFARSMEDMQNVQDMAT
eukprot:gene26970-34984_t